MFARLFSQGLEGVHGFIIEVPIGCQLDKIEEVSSNTGRVAFPKSLSFIAGCPPGLLLALAGSNRLDT